jgi:hypothetical protein
MSALDYSALSMSSHFDLLRELRIFFKEIRPGTVDRLMNVLTDQRFETDLAELTTRMPGYVSDAFKSLLDRAVIRPLVVRESRETYPFDLTSTRCLAAALVGLSLTVAALGSHIGTTLLLSMLSAAAILFSFSLIEARLR